MFTPTPQTQEEAFTMITRELYFKQDACPNLEYAVDVLDRYVASKRQAGRSDLELQIKLGSLERKLRGSPNAPPAWLDKLFQETHSRSNLNNSLRFPSSSSGRLNWKSLPLPLRRSSADSTNSSCNSSINIRRWAEGREWDEAPPAYTY